MIKGVIFDLDGTLADTLGDLQNSMNEMLSHFGFPQRDRDQIVAAICYGQREFVKRSMPEGLRGDSALIDKCQAYYSECYDKSYNASTHPYPDIEKALDKLCEKGIRLSVVTNKAQGHANEVVKKCFKQNIFDTVLGGNSGYPAKPSPEAALKAAEIMGVSASECVFVGDSDVDIITGKNAGMTSLGVSWGYRSKKVLENAGADLIAHNALQMMEMILLL